MGLIEMQEFYSTINPLCFGTSSLSKEKLRYDLIAPEILEGLAEVYTYGRPNRPADRSWEAGMPWMDQYASLMRHIQAWRLGEDLDRTSGLHHMIHATWRAGALYTYHKRGIGMDDRVDTQLYLRNLR